MSEWIGRTLSKVTIQKLLGRGGMAEVYLGVHNTLNRPVAVKILHGYLLEDETSLNRFRSEAQAVANMRHPNIVQVFDFDVTEDRPYIVMELLEGPSLADYLNVCQQTSKILPPEVTAHIITAVAAALDYAHSRGVIHRDVKPSNVLLRCETGALDPKAPLPANIQPVLTDFGVARLADTSVRTASGAIIGTPAYMSPEQVSGTAVDARSDIYSLGIMLYQMLSNRLPFGGDLTDTVASTLIKHITETPPPLPEVSPLVQAVVFRALAKDPQARYQKAGDLASDLRTALGVPVTPGVLAALTPAPVLSTSPTRVLKKPTTRSTSGRSRLTIGLVALLAVVGVLGILFASGVFGKSKKNPDAPSNTGSQQTVAGDSLGLLSFGDKAATADQVTLMVAHLPQPAAGTQYEAWLLGGENRKNLGVVTVDAQGNGKLVYVDSTGQDLLAMFDRFEITVEPSPDTNPISSGSVVYSGSVPAGPLTHVRHLLVSFSKAPNQIGLTIGILHDTALIVSSTQAIVDAQKAGNLKEMKRQAEGLANLIEGKGGQDYGDLDGDGTVTDPSDGFGLLPNTSSGGYIQTSINHASYAAGSPDATSYEMEQAKNLETAAQNLGAWGVQIEAAALAITKSKDVASNADSVQQLVTLAPLFAHGQDINGNGKIEPILNEGGADTVYFYAQRMADMTVLPGKDQVPAPAATPAPNTTSGAGTSHDPGY